MASDLSFLATRQRNWFLKDARLQKVFTHELRPKYTSWVKWNNLLERVMIYHQEFSIYEDDVDLPLKSENSLLIHYSPWPILWLNVGPHLQGCLPLMSAHFLQDHFLQAHILPSYTLQAQGEWLHDLLYSLLDKKQVRVTPNLQPMCFLPWVISESTSLRKTLCQPFTTNSEIVLFIPHEYSSEICLHLKLMLSMQQHKGWYRH